MSIESLARAGALVKWSGVLGLIILIRGLVGLLTSDPDPPDAAVDCTIEVVGLPRAAMESHRLKLGDVRVVVRPRVRLRLEQSTAELELTGPRYHGRVQVDRSRCRESAPISIEATPLPAHLDFTCAPTGLIVRCLDCPKVSQRRVHLAEEFPEIPMSRPQQQLELELRAPGYKRIVRSVIVYPGANSIRADMDRNPIPDPRVVAAPPCGR